MSDVIIPDVAASDVPEGVEIIVDEKWHVAWDIVKDLKIGMIMHGVGIGIVTVAALGLLCQVVAYARERGERLG